MSRLHGFCVITCSFYINFATSCAMVSNMMRLLWIMVVAWHVPGVHSVDDESDASHRRRREPHIVVQPPHPPHLPKSADEARSAKPTFQKRALGRAINHAFRDPSGHTTYRGRRCTHTELQTASPFQTGVRPNTKIDLQGGYPRETHSACPYGCTALNHLIPCIGWHISPWRHTIIWTLQIFCEALGSIRLLELYCHG